MSLDVSIRLFRWNYYFSPILADIFFARKDLRKQQLFLSFFVAPLAPLTQFLWFYHDYWRPDYLVSFRIGDVPLGAEELLFGFFIGGIAGVFYEFILRKQRSFGKPRTFLALVMVALALTLTPLFKSLGLNTIWAISLAMLVVALVMLVIDKDLIRDAVFSGLFMTLLGMFVYLVWLRVFPGVIQSLWLQEAFSGISLGRIPIEEIVWFFAAGFSGGIFYEFWFNAESYRQVAKKSFKKRGEL